VLEHGEFLCPHIVIDSSVFELQSRQLTVTMQEYLATFGYSNMCITVFYLIWTEKKSLYLSVLYVDLRFFLEL
jgi:hypothetical protein